MYDEEDGTKANGIEFLKIGIGNKNGSTFNPQAVGMAVAQP